MCSRHQPEEGADSQDWKAIEKSALIPEAAFREMFPDRETEEMNNDAEA